MRLIHCIISATGGLWDASLCGQLLNYVPGDDCVRPGVHDGFEEDATAEEHSAQEGQSEDWRGEDDAGTHAEDDCQEETGGLGRKKKRGGHGLIYVDLNATRSALYAHCKPIEDYLEAGWHLAGGEEEAVPDREALARREDKEEEEPLASQADGEYFGKYMIPDADLMKWKGYVFDIVTPDSKRLSSLPLCS